ncbi:MAG: hypothetical protein EOM55_02170 [Clostridia bacterium]|nr:hypothetical protein [Clostridia bacterium]
MKQIDEIAMRNASIFELRNVARDMGVRSPTIYKKEELIVKIMNIMKGEVKPELPKTRQGRPPKAGNKIYVNADNSFAFNGFEEKNSEENYDVKGFLDGRLFALSDDGIKFGNSNAKYIEDSGFLKLDKNGYGFLFNKGYVADAKKAIHVPNSFIKSCNLREGDFVECTCKYMDTQNARLLINIENEKDFKNRTYFNDLKSVKTNVNFSLGAPLEMKWQEGGRNVLLVQSLKNRKKMLSSFENISKEYSVFCLSLDVLPEDLPMKFDNFHTFAGDCEKKNVFTIELFIERIKRMVEEGKKVVVLVNELLKIVKYQNYINGNSMFDVKSKSFELCLQIMRLASVYDNGSSVTIFALLKQNNSNDCYNCLLGELENMNCEIVEIKL